MPDTRLAGFAPVVRADARLLILGSFPGKASLSAGQYYAHPRNLFWPILGRLIGSDLASLDYSARLQATTTAGVAIWDVLASCLRQGSLDVDIRQARSNQFEPLLAVAPSLRAVAFNGAKAAGMASWFAQRGLLTYNLPSTSPAHAALNLDAKLARWSVLVADGHIKAP